MRPHSRWRRLPALVVLVAGLNIAVWGVLLGLTDGGVRGALTGAGFLALGAVAVVVGVAGVRRGEVRRPATLLVAILGGATAVALGVDALSPDPALSTAVVAAAAGGPAAGTWLALGVAGVR